MAKKGPKKTPLRVAADDEQGTIDGSAPPFTETVTKKLRCVLSEEDELALLRSLQQTLADVRVLRDEKKKAASESDAKIKERMGHYATEEDQLEHGRILPVKVDVLYDFGKKTVTETRQDTGEATARPMTFEDRAKAQGSLELGGLQDHAMNTMAEALEGDKKDDGEEL